VVKRLAEREFIFRHPHEGTVRTGEVHALAA
jgi:hypothetical protein